MKFRRYVFTSVALAVMVAPATAGAMVPFEIQIPLVLKALTYDRSLKGRVTDQVRIAIVSPAKGNRHSVEELLASLGGLADRTLNGLPIKFQEMVAADEATLDDSLRAGRWAAVYVMPGFKPEELAQIRRVCAARHILAVAALVEDVEQGIAFGVGAQAGKPQLVVNLAGAKACGSDFDLALLRLARVIQ